MRTVELSILEGAMAQMATQAFSSPTPPTPAELAHMAAKIPTLEQLYVGMLQHGADAFATVARLVSAGTDDRPSAVLVHCTAGKDRTGVATALLRSRRSSSPRRRTRSAQRWTGWMPRTARPRATCARAA